MRIKLDTFDSQGSASSFQTGRSFATFSGFSGSWSVLLATDSNSTVLHFDSLRPKKKNPVCFRFHPKYETGSVGRNFFFFFFFLKTYLHHVI